MTSRKLGQNPAQHLTLPIDINPIKSVFGIQPTFQGSSDDVPSRSGDLRGRFPDVREDCDAAMGRRRLR